ncbi:MAG: DUF6502 family protein [Burkholderiales bacterium]
MNKRTLEQTLQSAAMAILRPLVRILLKHGVAYDTFGDWARWVYVDVADKEFSLPNRKQSASRVSIITGLSRKEVARLQEIAPFDEQTEAEEYNRAARVISGWLRDYPGQGDGEPSTLHLNQGEKNFATLVKRYSGDMPARAVMDELMRVGAVEKLGDDTLRLLGRTYIPHTSDASKIAIMGRDVSDLIYTIDHNLSCKPEQTFFHRTVFSNNLPDEALDKVRTETARHAQELLEIENTLLAKHDRDATNSSGGTGRNRASIGIYYFQDKYDPEKN